MQADFKPLQKLNYQCGDQKMVVVFKAYKEGKEMALCSMDGEEAELPVCDLSARPKGSFSVSYG